MKNLVIVESPAKAKTIEKFLGKDYKVLSSYGHIRDLSKKEIRPDAATGFDPEYEIPADKKELVRTLRKAAKEADMVWLASDEDREGEAIAWHLYEVLGLNPDRTRRIVFHEITKPAILNAIANPRGIDIDRVNAQQARRVLDRIVGFGRPRAECGSASNMRAGEGDRILHAGTVFPYRSEIPDCSRGRRTEGRGSTQDAR